MNRVVRVLSVAAPATGPDDAVKLDYDLRHRRRIALRSEGGIDFLLDLPEAIVLRDGDRLLLDDGRSIAVRAAPEPLAEIRAADAAALTRVAWHIGNRHLPAAIAADRLLIRRDHVIEEMVRGLGARVRHVTEPFEPEGGAYSHGHAQPASDHAHSSDHEQKVDAHDHERSHGRG